MKKVLINSTNLDNDKEVVIVEELNENNEVVNVSKATEVSKENEVETISSIVPLSLASYETSKGKIIAMVWLCELEEDYITIQTNYLIEHKAEEKIISMIKFSNENKHIANIITDRLIIDRFDQYISELEFNIELNNDGSAKEIYFDAYKVKNRKIANKKKFIVNENIFASIKYIDEYISECNINEYELHQSTLTGAMIDDKEIPLFQVDFLDSLIALAPVDAKEGNVVAVFKVGNFKNKDEKEFATLLVPFSIDARFKRSKFKGNTVEKLESTYFVEEDQYINNFLFFAKFKNIDKEYMFIKASNNKGEEKIFSLDISFRTQLQEKILEY